MLMPARCHNTIIKEHDHIRTLEFVQVQCPRPGGRRATMHDLSIYTIYIYLSICTCMSLPTNMMPGKAACMRLLATRASTS